MRQDYAEFRRQNTEILAIGPDGRRAFARYWTEEQIPFPGLPDPRHTVANVYGQEVNWLKFGRMPALFVVDRAGQIRYRYYGQSMSDIPANSEVLAQLRLLNRELAGDNANQTLA